NEGCYILPLLETDVQKSPVQRPPSSQAFLLYFALPVFLTPFLEGRSIINLPARTSTFVLVLLFPPDLVTGRKKIKTALNKVLPVL
ncbi:MAG TPA: hypothetical protein PLH09_13050, partial [Lentimicrobium sp.]|nr:hypothetical protein [Lentimicrobium sp.]